MEHHYIKTSDNAEIRNVVIFQRDNNLDKLDNLDDLPVLPAVFAVCGRVNGAPANPRYVGETDNLQRTVRNLFDPKAPAPEGNALFKEFMLSIKIKELVYLLLPASDEAERSKHKAEWTERFQPKCTEEMNEIH